MYPIAKVMTELQFPLGPYHLTAGHSPMMQQSSHSPMIHHYTHSPMMQHYPVDQNHSLALLQPQPPPAASFLSVTSPFSNPSSSMAYSPANVQFPQGDVACQMYPSTQEPILDRLPPEYPIYNGYYGMTATAYSHDQM